MHVEYVLPDARRTQTFLARPLSTQEFEDALRAADLAVDAYLAEDRTWVHALPIADPNPHPLSNPQ